MRIFYYSHNFSVWDKQQTKYDGELMYQKKGS